MGRLFWKFFLIFWLAQFVTAAGVGITIWLEHSAHIPGPGFVYGGPPPPPDFLGAHRPPPNPGEMIPHHVPAPLVPILAGSLVSLIFAAIMAWYFARPIRNLRDAFKSVAAGRLETRIGSSMGWRNDELADLGKYFDHMAGRLQNLIETQRRLLHDVSHELRSPLARLQAAADLMQQQPDRGAEFAERIQRDTARMDTLVGELLALARLDAGMTGNLDNEVDLQEIVTDVADDARIEVDSKGCSLLAKMEDLAIVRGNRELLYRAIENVVRNAVRHSPQGQTIEISTCRVGESLRVVVADRGPGVSADDLAAIFEPFVRSGLERSPSGYGLGLAITRRVAEAHGGTVFAANRPEGGLLVTLELPFGSERFTAPIGELEGK